MNKNESISAKEKNADRIPRVRSLLKRLHPDILQSKITNRDSDHTNTQAIFISGLTKGTYTPEEYQGKEITLVFFTEHGSLTHRQFVVPATIEETLTELENLIEDADDPTPPEHRPTIDKFRDDLNSLTDTDEVRDAFSKLAELHEAGELEDKYFLPLWQELRRLAATFLNQSIAACKTKEALAAELSHIENLTNIGLLDTKAVDELTKKISLAEHYLNQEESQLKGFRNWFSR